jgi:hypothetical protein
MEKEVMSKLKVLKFLQKGNGLNAVVAQKEFGCVGSTLAFYIWQLRQEGWQIQTKMKKSFMDQKYAEYTLHSSWRYPDEEERRKDIAIAKLTPKVHALSDFKIGDRVLIEGLKEEGVIRCLITEGTPFADYENIPNDGVVIEIATDIVLARPDQLKLIKGNK